MGNKASRSGELKKKTVAQFAASTRFDPEEIRALYGHYCSIKERGEEADDEFVTLSEFQKALGVRRGQTSRFVTRLFQIFDENKDNRLNFEEFVRAVALLSPNGTHQEKTKFSFDIYNASGDGFITREELRDMLHATLTENDVVLSPEESEALVERTFAEADLNGDGKIDYEEFKVMVEKHPSILKPLTLNVSQIIREAKEHGASPRPSAGGGGGGAAGGAAPAAPAT